MEERLYRPQQGKSSLSLSINQLMDKQKRLTVMIALCCSQQLGGVTLIYSYSTCKYRCFGAEQIDGH